MGPNQTYKLLHSKGKKKKKKKKKTYKMGENIYKLCSWQGLNLQNIQMTQQQKPNNSMEKLTEHLNRHFSKEDTQSTWSISLIIRKMQIKTTIKYYLTPVRRTIINKSTNNKCWRGCREKSPPTLWVEMLS